MVNLWCSQIKSLAGCSLKVGAPNYPRYSPALEAFVLLPIEVEKAFKSKWLNLCFKYDP